MPVPIKKGRGWRDGESYFLIFSCSLCLFKLIRLFKMTGYSAEGKKKTTCIQEKDIIISEINNIEWLLHNAHYDKRKIHFVC